MHRDAISTSGRQDLGRPSPRARFLVDCCRACLVNRVARGVAISWFGTTGTGRFYFAAGLAFLNNAAAAAERDVGAFPLPTCFGSPWLRVVAQPLLPLITIPLLRHTPQILVTSQSVPAVVIAATRPQLFNPSPNALSKQAPAAPPPPPPPPPPPTQPCLLPPPAAAAAAAGRSWEKPGSLWALP